MPPLLPAFVINLELAREACPVRSLPHDRHRTAIDLQHEIRGRSIGEGEAKQAVGDHRGRLELAPIRELHQPAEGLARHARLRRRVGDDRVGFQQLDIFAGATGHFHFRHEVGDRHRVRDEDRTGLAILVRPVELGIDQRLMLSHGARTFARRAYTRL